MPSLRPPLKLLFFVPLLAAACGTAAPAAVVSPAPPGATVNVVTDPATIGTYSPPSTSVRAGQEVRWTFVDRNPHSVTSDTAGIFDSKPMANGRGFTHRFEAAGTYAYHCSIHPEMHGTVVVD